MRDIPRLIERHFADWRAGWSMGSFGAIAEFHRDKDEKIESGDGERLSLVTERGAVAFEMGRLADVRPVAYEALSPKRHRWSHGIMLCLPEPLARRKARSTLAELGPDADAVRPKDQAAVLFDLGLSLPQCDFCIRASDPSLIEILRANLGRSLFGPGNMALGAILSAHPHRVVLTAAGRVEVFQKIGGPDTAGVSPAGPHTHLLPKLLKSGRTHSANTPIPQGFMPIGSLHPANPVMDPMGGDQPFAPELHVAFQALLRDFGWPNTVPAKQAIIQAVAEGVAPTDFKLPADRFKRTAARIALRQQQRIAEQAGYRDLRERLQVWREIHDATGRGGADEEEDAPGH